jgi:cellulose synthase/poly-beta-1,6-N-acetylglucosamine synthase-like glycosyltransferase
MPARPRVAFIATVYQEAGNIAAFLDSLLAQTRQPDEIVILDAGSRDATPDLLRQYQARDSRIKLLFQPGANRSRGRNLAIAHTPCELIAAADAGCRLDPAWLENIAAPLENDPATAVAAGYYRPLARSLFSRAVAAATVPSPREVNPERFLPSGRSVAFRRAAWQAAGGYPEWTAFSEDTLFGLALKRAGAHFRFVPGALVFWEMAAGPGRLFRQFFRYARSDARNRLFFGHHAKAYLLLALLLALLAAACFIPWAWSLLPAAALAYYLRYCLRSRLRGADWPAALLSPAATLLVDLANLLGFSLGFLSPRLRAPVFPPARPACQNGPHPPEIPPDKESP